MAGKNNTQTDVKKVMLYTIRKQKLLSFGLVFAVAGAIVMALLPPLVLAKIIDTISQRQKVSGRIILLYFGLLACTGLMESAREVMLTIFGQKMTHALRSSLMGKFMSLTTENINKQEPGALVSRFIGDVDTVENLFTSGIISMFADVCKIISILSVIWCHTPGLTLILLLLLPVLFLFTRYVQKKTLTAQIRNRKALGRASGHVPETLHNIRTIHCLGKENYMEERYDTYINDSYQAMEKTNFYDAIYSPVILILNAAVVAAVMLLSASGSSLILTFFGMSAGTAVAIINYIAQIFSPVENIGMEIQTIQSALAGIRRINEFMELEEKLEPEEKVTLKNRNNERKASPGSAKNPIVSFDQVTFGYDEHVVLNQVSFQVEEGDQVTLLGRTGAGKSTVFKLLLGLYTPQKGEVLINGIPASQLMEGQRRKWCGYVEQSFHMVPGTVKDQITLYDDSISDEQVQAAAALTGLDMVIAALEKGYDTVCTPELFSQGQWQLLSIARAAAAEPKLLLLDEITANLDAKTEQQVMQTLKRVSEKRTVIAISHRVSAEIGRVIHING